MNNGFELQKDYSGETGETFKNFRPKKNNRDKLEWDKPENGEINSKSANRRGNKKKQEKYDGEKYVTGIIPKDENKGRSPKVPMSCLLYTSDAADE